MAVDPGGDLVIASRNVIRVSVASGAITSIAGGGTVGDSDGAKASTVAFFNGPAGVGVDGAGNIYTGDFQQVQKISAKTGLIARVAGQTVADIEARRQATATDGFGIILRVAADSAGDVYVLTTQSISKVVAGSAMIRNVAQLTLHNPTDSVDPNQFAVSANGDVFFEQPLYNDTGCTILRVSGSSGAVTLFAGTGNCSGGVPPKEGAAATSVLIHSVAGMAAPAKGNLYFVLNQNPQNKQANGVWRVDGVTGQLSFIGILPADCNGSPMAADKLGNLYVMGTGIFCASRFQVKA